ncbi:hydroxymethylbilane synthase [Ilumatobacter coccineus]|uniref:hydroxymethylbilane synthase n=1 Tax=Ilumatobacter coccineus TaxID=467094 RepID=UPI00034882A8|nr:hydroxymethylbilane synthase [Ilumatobacter coccineus]
MSETDGNVPDTAPLRIATRSSQQASTQAGAVASALTAATGRPVELVFVDTVGDRTQADNVPLHSIGGQGVFVKEVQNAVLDGRADLAVHSAKDLTSDTTPGLRLAAFTERRDAHDVLVGATLDELPLGALVATGSVRRRAQLAAVRPDLEFAELRGNIGTRLSKVPDGGAIVMAKAALLILELTEHIAEELSLSEFVPAVGQGCVAIECRVDDDDTRRALATIDHAPTRRAVEIERAFLSELGSGCSLPVAGHVRGSGLDIFVADPERSTSVRHRVELRSHPDGHESVDADLAAARQGARDAMASLAGQVASGDGA